MELAPGTTGETTAAELEHGADSLRERLDAVAGHRDDGPVSDTEG